MKVPAVEGLAVVSGVAMDEEAGLGLTYEVTVAAGLRTATPVATAAEYLGKGVAGAKAAAAAGSMP